MQIGVTIPPISQTEFSVLADDKVLEEGRPILGSFVGVNFTRNEQDALLLGTVVDFQVVNDLSEYLAVAKNVQAVMTNEQVQRIVKRKSGLILKCQITSAFGGERKTRIPYDTPIHPFAPCKLIGEQQLQGILQKPMKGGTFFHVGRYFGCKLFHYLHLADFSGLNEAYHFVIAGLSGSGKSTLAKLLLVGYARNPEMSFFILDTTGEFARSFKDQDKSGFPLKMASLWEMMGREDPQVLGLDNLSLDRWNLLEELLVRDKVFEPLRVKHAENQRRAAEHLVIALREEKITLGDLSILSEDKLKALVTTEGFLKAAYSDKQRREEVAQAVKSSMLWKEFWRRFKKVASHFQKGRPTPEGLVKKLKENPGTTLILDLSTLGWEEPLKYLLIRDVVSRIYRIAMESYRKSGKAEFNTLVMVEEAHRLVPPASWVGENEELAETRKILLRALAETRKAGLGWMFISTRLGNLDRGVFEEARVKIIGRGLSTGEDADRIRQAFGREVLTYYASLPDPTDPLTERRQHVFLVSGPICVLSRQAPEFIEVFDNPAKFLESNSIAIEQTPGGQHGRGPF